MFRSYRILPYYFVFFILLLACNDDDDSDNIPASACDETSTPLYQEASSILQVEFENATFTGDWVLVNDLSNATGAGFMQWEGDDSFGRPSDGLASFQIQINNPGTYRFIWRSAVKEGDNPTEGNDTWLRFADADDFFGEKNNGSIVYPNGTGKTPNPEGASADGWFKIYRSGEPLDFKWQARTSDNDAHDVFVTFNSAGTYLMEISGRAKGHAIDKFVMFDRAVYTEDEALAVNTFSTISCN